MDPIVVGPTPPEPYRDPGPLVWTDSSGRVLSLAPASKINRANKSASERQLTLAAENAPVRLIYGQARVGALLLNVLNYSGYVVLQCVWGLECEGVQSVTLNNAALPDGSLATHYDGSQSSADATMVAAFAAQSPSITYADTLEGYCYSVLRIPVRKLTGGLSVNAVVKGRKVYDPRTGLTVYSTNPSLCLADFLRSTEYGAGVTVDDTTLTTCANFNDATTIGEVHRRLDGWTLDSVTGVGTVVETLRTYAGVFLSRRGATVYLIPDQARASDATYAHASGHIASFSDFVKRDIGNAPTVVEVSWTDTSTTPQRDRTASASLPGVGTTLPRRVSGVQLNGIQRNSQAYREAVLRLNQLSSSDLSGSAVIFDQGIAHEVGDVITLTLPIGITSKDFRVTEVQGAGPGLWQLGLTEYDSAAYSTEIQSEPTYPDTQLPSPADPPAPTVDAVEELYRTESGVYATRARLTITSATFLWLDRYDVEIYDGETLVDSGTTREGSYASPPLQDGLTYTCRARIVSTIGATGDWGQDTFTAVGKSVPPTDVSSMTGFEVGGDVYLSWTAAVDTDIWRYEIRWGTTGATWETASLLDRVDSLRYISKGVITPGVRRFFVKALDSAGNYSATAAYCDVTVTIDPDSLQLEYYPDNPTLTGMSTFTERDGSIYDVTVVGTSSFATTFSSNVSTYTQPVSAYWGGTSSWEGDSDDPWGVVVAATWDLDGTASDVGTGTSTATLRLGTNGTAFTDYTGAGLPAKASARYARAKFNTTACMKVTRGQQRIYGNAVTRTEYGSIAVTSTGTPGATVSLTGQYFQRRNLLLTPVDNGTGAMYAVADNISLSTSTTNTFDVYLFGTAGRLAGDVDYRFEGI